MYVVRVLFCFIVTSDICKDTKINIIIIIVLAALNA